MSKICTVALLAWEKYIPVMTEAELEMLKSGYTDWDILTVARWQHLRGVRKMFTEDRIKTSMQKSAREGGVQIKCKETK